MRGKYSEHQTVRSILKSLPHISDSSIIRAGIGDDYGRLLLRPGDKSLTAASGVCMDDGTLGLKTDMARLYNSIAVGHAVPFAMTDTIIMPADDERAMKRLLRKLAGIAGQLSVEIAAGHTEISDAVTKPVVSVTMFGRSSFSMNGKDGGRIDAGKYDIVMCGQTGIAGTLEKYYAHRDALNERYSKTYLGQISGLENLLTLGSQIDVAYAHGIVYAHDISHGGAYAALWEMGDALDTGFVVSHDAIPILQETIEICEFTGDNPYMIDGCGAVLFVTADGEALSDKLYEAGFEARVIGHLTDGRDRVITHDDETRYLTPPRYV